MDGLFVVICSFGNKSCFRIHLRGRKSIFASLVYGLFTALPLSKHLPFLGNLVNGERTRFQKIGFREMPACFRSVHFAAFLRPEIARNVAENRHSFSGNVVWESSGMFWGQVGTIVPAQAQGQLAGTWAELASTLACPIEC